MGKVAIVTDSNSGITQDLARDLGVSVIPMPFYINEKLYLEGITLSQEEFYERLKNEESISTSQPGPADVCGLWNAMIRLCIFQCPADSVLLVIQPADWPGNMTEKYR